MRRDQRDDKHVSTDNVIARRLATGCEEKKETSGSSFIVIIGIEMLRPRQETDGFLVQRRDNLGHELTAAICTKDIFGGAAVTLGRYQGRDGYITSFDGETLWLVITLSRISYLVLDR